MSVVDNVGPLVDSTDMPSLFTRPWLLATVPALATLAVLLPLRLVPVAAGVEGPWSGPAETSLDVAIRAGIVWVIVGTVGTLAARSSAER